MASCILITNEQGLRSHKSHDNVIWPCTRSKSKYISYILRWSIKRYICCEWVCIFLYFSNAGDSTQIEHSIMHLTDPSPLISTDQLAVTRRFVQLVQNILLMTVIRYSYYFIGVDKLAVLYSLCSIVLGYKTRSSREWTDISSRI